MSYNTGPQVSAPIMREVDFQDPFDLFDLHQFVHVRSIKGQ